jgi:hypothetical protein
MKPPWWTGLRLRELHGRHMILLDETWWRDVIIPAGTLCTLDVTQTRWEELHVTFAPCSQCGRELRKRVNCGRLDFDPAFPVGGLS